MSKPYSTSNLTKDAKGCVLELHRDKVLTDYQFNLIMAAIGHSELTERKVISFSRSLS